MRTVFQLTLLACAGLVACASSAGAPVARAHRPVVVAAPPPQAAAPAGEQQRQPERCAHGETVEACFERALAIARGEDVPKDPQKAFELFVSGCSLGSSAACNGAAWGFYHGRGGRKDPASAGNYFARGCPTGNEDAQACDSRGFALLTGFADTKRDEVRASELLQSACREGVFFSCIALKVYGPLGLGEPEIPRPDIVCMYELEDLETICLEVPGPQECWLASMMLLTGTCVEADHEKGMEFYRAAQTLGVPWPDPPPASN